MRVLGIMNSCCRNRRFRAAFFVWTLLLLAAEPAAAHKVSVFAWVEGDLIHTESKFSRGKMVKGGRIVVSDLQGNRILEGDTNGNGLFSFKVPKRASLKVELQAGMGHRAEWIIQAEELGVDPLPGKAGPETQGTSTARQPEDTLIQTESSPALTADEVQQAVERALDRKLGPALKMLAESRERTPNLTDVLSGIGYILGLVGVAAYFHYRKKGNRDSSP